MSMHAYLSQKISIENGSIERQEVLSKTIEMGVVLIESERGFNYAMMRSIAYQKRALRSSDHGLRCRTLLFKCWQLPCISACLSMVYHN